MHASVPMDPPAFVEFQSSSRRKFGAWFRLVVGEVLTTTESCMASQDIPTVQVFSDDEINEAIKAENDLFQGIRESELERYLGSL